MRTPASMTRPRHGWMLAVALVVGLCAAWPAIGAETLTLSNLRVEPDPVEAYGRMTIRVGFSGAQTPVKRLWVRLLRQGQRGDPMAEEIRWNSPPGASGSLTVGREMGVPGPRSLSLVAEDTAGNRSAPLELRFTVVEPPRRYEEVTYLSDGLKIRGYLYRPSGSEPSAAIIYSRGSKSAAREPPQPYRIEWLAYRLARLGYVTFVAERRGYGGSEGQSVEIGEPLNARQWSVRGELKDILSGIGFLKERPGVDSKRIALLGQSLGGALSLLAAAERPELRAVVSMAGGLGYSDGPGLLYIQSELLSAARRIQVPSLLMHAENDRVVPVRYSRQVHEELGRRGIPAVAKFYPPFKVAGKEQEGHYMFTRADGLSYFWKDLTGFLADILKP